MKKLIAVTGGIGSGKSSLLRILYESGYPVFSCDEIYREVLLSPEYIQKIGKFFPDCINNGSIDKIKLAEIVFNNKEQLSILNNIAHPLIMDRLFEKMHNCPHDIVFAEVPLLFEGNYENLFNSVIVVRRNKEDRIHSIVQRDNTSREQAIQRIAAQFDYDNPENRFHKCNAILIDNNSAIEDLKLKIQAIKF